MVFEEKSKNTDAVPLSWYYFTGIIIFSCPLILLIVILAQYGFEGLGKNVPPENTYADVRQTCTVLAEGSSEYMNTYEDSQKISKQNVGKDSAIYVARKSK